MSGSVLFSPFQVSCLPINTFKSIYEDTQNNFNSLRFCLYLKISVVQASLGSYCHRITIGYYFFRQSIYIPDNFNFCLAHFIYVYYLCSFIGGIRVCGLMIGVKMSAIGREIWSYFSKDNSL